MSILAAFMVPHPPMIVPEIGKGSEKQVTDTIVAYDRVADEVAALEPDTLIITSPHAVMYADYFHISPGKAAAGSFRQFRAPGVRFSEQYDTELVNRICALSDEAGFPAGTLGERDAALDHGTMVPLWFIRKKYTGGRIVRIGLSGLSLTDHYRLGQIVARAVEDTGTRAVFIASGDLSHKLQEYGPYGFAKEGPEYDRRIMDVCSRAAFGELFDFDETFCDKAAECGHRSFVIMAGALDGLSVKATVLCHQDVTGVGYGICTFYPEGTDPNRHFLKAYQEKAERECPGGNGPESAFFESISGKGGAGMPRTCGKERSVRQAGAGFRGKLGPASRAHLRSRRAPGRNADAAGRRIRLPAPPRAAAGLHRDDHGDGEKHRGGDRPERRQRLFQGSPVFAGNSG